MQPPRSRATSRIFSCRYSPIVSGSTPRAARLRNAVGKSIRRFKFSAARFETCAAVESRTQYMALLRYLASIRRGLRYQSLATGRPTLNGLSG